MTTLAAVPLCSRGVDLLIYGISAAVSLQVAAQLRYPERLIPTLPPQRLQSTPGKDGPITGEENTPLDGSRPPKEITDIVRQTLQSYGLPEAKVQHYRPHLFRTRSAMDVSFRHLLTSRPARP